MGCAPRMKSFNWQCSQKHHDRKHKVFPAEGGICNASKRKTSLSKFSPSKKRGGLGLR